MNVLHLCTNFWPTHGGIEQFVQELALATAQAGVQAHVLCFDRANAGDMRLPPRDEVHGVPIQRVPFVDLKFYKPSLLPLEALRQADVLHVHGIGAMLDYVVATRRWHHRPIVMSTHGGIFHTERLRRIKHWYFSAVQPRVLRHVGRVIACSQSDFEQFRPITSEGQITLIENGVNTERFNHINDEQREAGRLVCVGRVADNKRLDRVLRAFARMSADNTLNIVGADWNSLTAGLRLLADQLGISQRVSFVGEVDERGLCDQLSRASLFVSASEHEGLGISAVEAMAAGCVPVLSDIPAFREVLSTPAVGRLVDFADPAAAARALTETLAAADPNQRAACRARAAEYDWQAKIPQWMAVYREAQAAGQVTR